MTPQKTCPTVEMMPKTNPKKLLIPSLSITNLLLSFSGNNVVIIFLGLLLPKAIPRATSFTRPEEEKLHTNRRLCAVSLIQIYSFLLKGNIL